MARPAKRVICDDTTKAKLIEIARSRTQQSGLSLRVKIILQCLEGKSVQDTASSCGVCTSTVIRWKGRFIENGLSGLSDHTRSGRPAIYQEEFRQSVLKKLEQAPPDGFAKWDGALLARELGYSKDAIWRLLREHRISLTRKRTWCISTDPEFVAKAADIVGLYLARDDKALVICVDEKPNIQALKFRTGYTPTSASWLNMVEIWLGILTRKSLRGASFANTSALCEHIRKFIEAYNPNAKPFVWKKREVKGAQLANNVLNFYN